MLSFGVLPGRCLGISSAASLTVITSLWLETFQEWASVTDEATCSTTGCSRGTIFFLLFPFPFPKLPSLFLSLRHINPLLQLKSSTSEPLRIGKEEAMQAKGDTSPEHTGFRRPHGGRALCATSLTPYTI